VNAGKYGIRVHRHARIPHDSGSRNQDAVLRIDYSRPQAPCLAEMTSRTYAAPAVAVVSTYIRSTYDSSYVNQRSRHLPVEEKKPQAAVTHFSSAVGRRLLYFTAPRRRRPAPPPPSLSPRPRRAQGSDTHARERSNGGISLDCLRD
jgi:hypothetical protein